MVTATVAGAVLVPWEPSRRAYLARVSAASIDLDLVARRLADRAAGRSEATVQSDVRLLLVAAGLNLLDGQLEDVVLEAPVGKLRRIDVEVGSTVIEVKRDLRVGNVRAEAVPQLAGYVTDRTANTGARYTGILTDGTEWLRRRRVVPRVPVRPVRPQPGYSRADRVAGRHPGHRDRPDAHSTRDRPPARRDQHCPRPGRCRLATGAHARPPRAARHIPASASRSASRSWPGGTGRSAPVDGPGFSRRTDPGRCRVPTCR